MTTTTGSTMDSGIAMLTCLSLLVSTMSACGTQGEEAPPARPAALGAIEGPDGLRDQPTSPQWKDTSPGWTQVGPKILLTGTIYQADGRTPASDVVLYYYQTDIDGRYRHRPDQSRSMPPDELGRTHGWIRGWVKTGPDGRYAIYTVRPGAYPTNDEPAHIHATIKEPDLPEYYIDDFVFDDDPLLTTRVRLRMEQRCGSGILRLVRRDEVLVGERDILLGQNVPGHPRPASGGASSGRKIGEDVISFTPFHAWGPDKGSRTCPVCKYGWYHGVLLFAGDDPNWQDLKAWLSFLEAESARRKDRLKVYFVYGAARDFDRDTRTRELEALGRELDLRHVALTFVPSLADQESEVALNRIDPGVKSTIILYRRSRIVDKAIDLPANAESFRWLQERLDRSSNEYFDLPKPTP